MKRQNIIFILIFSFLASSPLYAQFDDIYKKVKKEIEKEVAKDTVEKKTGKSKTDTKLDTACVSDYHRTHKGEMAFCTEKNPDLYSDIGFGSSFNENEKVTACVYLEKCISNYKTMDNNGTRNDYFIKIFVDGVEEQNVFQDHFSSGDTKAFSVRVLGNDGGILTNSGNFSSRLIKMNAGEHKIRFEVYGGSNNGYKTSQPIARGEFTLVKGEPEKEKSYGRWSDVKAGMNNSRLEQQAIDAVNEKAQREGWKERYSKAVITSYDWATVRNEWTSIITGRVIDMTLYGTWPDGTCRKVEFSFWQDYDGTRYTNSLYYNGIGSMYLIDCE